MVQSARLTNRETHPGMRSPARTGAGVGAPRWSNVEPEKATSSVSVIVPVLNEAETIGGFLRELPVRAPEAEIIVADGGSCDASREIAEKPVTVHEAEDEIERVYHEIRQVLRVTGVNLNLRTWATFSYGDATC